MDYRYTYSRNLIDSAPIDVLSRFDITLSG